MKDALSRYCAELSFEGYHARLCATSGVTIDYKRLNSFDLQLMAGKTFDPFAKSFAAQCNP